MKKILKVAGIFLMLSFLFFLSIGGTMYLQEGRVNFLLALPLTFAAGIIYTPFTISELRIDL